MSYLLTFFYSTFAPINAINILIIRYLYLLWNRQQSVGTPAAHAIDNCDACLDRSGSKAQETQQPLFNVGELK